MDLIAVVGMVPSRIDIAARFGSVVVLAIIVLALAVGPGEDAVVGYVSMCGGVRGEK